MLSKKYHNVQKNKLAPGGTYRKRLDGNADRRRVPSGKVAQTYRVTEMTDKHHEVARLLLLGLTNKEVASETSLSRDHVSTIRRSPVVKEQLTILRSVRDRESVDIAVQIQNALPRCIEYLTETIDGDGISDALKSKNAFNLLSMGGHGPSKNLNVKSTHAILTADDIMEIRERGLSLGTEMGIVDAEVLHEEHIDA